MALVVEIADATLNRDRVLKRRIYAAARIPWYWILDLNARTLEACSEPKDGAYQRGQMFSAGDMVPLALEGRVVGDVSVDELLPAGSDI